MSPITIEQLIAQLREANAVDHEKRAQHTDKLATMRAAEAKGETVDADGVAKLRSKKADIDSRVELRAARIAQLEADLASDRAAAALSTEVRETGARKPAYDGVARIGSEKRTYNPENDPKGRQFMADLAASALGGFEARENLARHMAEEKVERGTKWMERATSTGSFVGLTVPQYLTDQFAPNAKAMRPFAEASRKMDLPSQGMVVNISRITTPATAAVQATQNNSVSNQDLADTLLTIPVQTMAAQQTMSRQAIERSTGAEAVTLDDLIRTYHTQLDSTLLNQAVTGLTNVAAANDISTGAPTKSPGLIYAQMLKARSGVEAVLLDTQEGDQLAVMHSRRWAAIASGTSSSFPFVFQNVGGGPFTQGGQDPNLNYGPGYRGMFGGLNVIVDNNVTTTSGNGSTQDEIYVVNRRECILWEDPSAPVMIRAEQTNAASLGVLFVVYGYFAYTFLRYQSGGFSAHQKLNSVTGSYLGAPAFDGTGF